MPERIRVEVAYATPEHQEIAAVEIAAGSTVADAIRCSDFERRFGDSLQGCETGIWGSLAPRDQLLEDGDRVEIYRKLARDPMEARRELARLQRSGSSS